MEMAKMSIQSDIEKAETTYVEGISGKVTIILLQITTYQEHM
jgi:hypothetical protein